MRVINVYIKELHVVLVLFYRFVHGKCVRHCYVNPYPASVQRLTLLLENRDSSISGENGMLIQTFQFVP